MATQHCDFIDLTLDDEDNDQRMAPVSNETVPFVESLQVPKRFVPVCQTLTQSLKCDSIIQNHLRKYDRKKADSPHAIILSYLNVYDAFNALDMPDPKTVLDYGLKDYDLEKTIFEFSKLYMLCKLIEELSRHEAMTDMQMMVITEKEWFEKTLYKVFREYCGCFCVRLTRMEENAQAAAGVNDGGLFYGVLIRLGYDTRAIPTLEDTQFLINYDSTITDKHTNMIIEKLKLHNAYPIVLNLTSLDTAESRWKAYVDSLTIARSLEIFARHSNEDMKRLYFKSNKAFTAEECLLWNDAVAKQVAEFMMTTTGEDFEFVAPVKNTIYQNGQNEDPMDVDEPM